MARYAQLVATGDRTAPYSDADVERFARAALVDASELDAHINELLAPRDVFASGDGQENEGDADPV